MGCSSNIGLKSKVLSYFLLTSFQKLKDNFFFNLYDLAIRFPFCRWQWVPMVLYACPWAGCLPWVRARGQWARGCPRDRCHKATVVLKRNMVCRVDTRCLEGIKCLLVTRCPLVTNFHLATRCLQGSNICRQANTACRGQAWATWLIKGRTARTRCPPLRTWCRNPRCRKAPATPPPPCPNTTPPTRHTRPIQAPTPHTLTPPLTSLRAGKTLISVSIFHHLVILIIDMQLDRL